MIQNLEINISTTKQSKTICEGGGGMECEVMSYPKLKHLCFIYMASLFSYAFDFGTTQFH